MPGLQKSSIHGHTNNITGKAVIDLSQNVEIPEQGQLNLLAICLMSELVSPLSPNKAMHSPGWASSDIRESDTSEASDL